MSEGLRILPGFPAAQRAEVARIYWEAFGGKLGLVMGPAPRALAYLHRVMREDHCFSAYDRSGRLIGIAGFKTPQGSFAGGSPQDMRQIYGGLGALWRGFALQLLTRDVDNERFLIDGIAVTASARGCGAGTALLQALYAEGLRRGYHQIRLEVIEGNWRAKALYQREGFAVVATERLGPLRHLFGFEAAATMVRPLHAEIDG